MNLGKQITEGAGHKVYEHESDPHLLIKVPKQGFMGAHFEDVEKDIALARVRFGRWIPKTEISRDHDYGFVIVQEKVEQARHITPDELAKADIRAQVEEILAANRNSLAQDGIGLDFIGLEGSAKCVLVNQKKWKGTFIDFLIITPILRLALWLKKKFPELLIPDQVLTWWEENALKPEITNLIIGEVDGQDCVFIVDPSLVHRNVESRKERVRTAILQIWNGRFMRKNFGLEL